MLLALAVVWAVKRRRAARAVKSARYSGDFGPVSRNVSDPIYNPEYGHRTDFLRRGDSSIGSAHSPMGQIGHNTTAPSDRSPSALLKTPRVRSLFSRGTPRTPPQQMTQQPPRLQDPYITPTRSGGGSGGDRMMHHRAGSRDSGSTVTPISPGLGRSDSTETIDVLMPAPSFLQLPPPSVGKGVGGGMPCGGGKKSRPVTQNTTFSCLMEGTGWEPEERGMVRKLSNGQQVKVPKYGASWNKGGTYRDV